MFMFNATSRGDSRKRRLKLRLKENVHLLRNAFSEITLC